MSRILALCLLLVMAPPAIAQTITVEVWTHSQPGNPPQPSSSAAVRMYPAANIPVGMNVPVQKPVPAGPRQNQYVFNGSAVAPLVDVTAMQTGYHPWTARDLYLVAGEDQKLGVQLFKYDYPIKAPQCFALKTQYELSFRKEQQLFRNDQQLGYDAELKAVQHIARLKYADGILSLPDPSPYHKQSIETEQMLAEMSRESRDELDKMVGGLFDLYKMDTFGQYAPSQWQTQYKAPNGQTVNCEVQLFGTHGTYTTQNGARHILENIDIFYEENADGGSNSVIAGHWRFAPETPQESQGTFRWQVDGSDHFEGDFQRPGDGNKYSWKGDRVPQPQREEPEDVSSDVGQPSPPVDGPVPAPRLRGPRRIPAPAPALPAPAPPAPQL